MHGLPLIKKAILTHGLKFWQVERNGHVIAGNWDEETDQENSFAEFEEFANNEAPPGSYKVYCSSQTDNKNKRIKKGNAGTGYVCIDFVIQNNVKADHIDINSHNATNKEISELKTQLVKFQLEQELKRLEDKYEAKIKELEEGNDFKKAIDFIQHPEVQKYLPELFELLKVVFSKK